MSFASIMKKTAVAGVMALAIAAPAKADWSGLYIGASVGWVGLNDVTGVFPNGPFAQQPGDSDNLLVGGHIGIQHQWGQIVVGLEASYSGTPADRESSSGLCFNPAFRCDVDLRSMFTIGGRLGFAPSHQWMVYVSGGYASAWMNSTTFLIANGSQFDRASARHEGWYIGGGFDWNLHGNWILGLEYQHLFLDSENHISSSGAPINDRVIEADADIVRVRLSYKWGRPVEALK